AGICFNCLTRYVEQRPDDAVALFLPIVWYPHLARQISAGKQLMHHRFVLVIQMMGGEKDTSAMAHHHLIEKLIERFPRRRLAEIILVDIKPYRFAQDTVRCRHIHYMGRLRFRCRPLPVVDMQQYKASESVPV